MSALTSLDNPGQTMLFDIDAIFFTVRWRSLKETTFSALQQGVQKLLKNFCFVGIMYENKIEGLIL